MTGSSSQISQKEFIELLGNAIEVTVAIALLNGDWRGFECFLAKKSTNRWESHRIAEGIA